MKTYPLYLNGEFVASEPAWNVANPATGEAFAQISAVNRQRVAQALVDAHSKTGRHVPQGADHRQVLG